MSEWLSKLQAWFATILVRFGHIKQVSYCKDELNELMQGVLPFLQDFEVPGGRADLAVLTADINLGNNNAEGLSIDLLCSFDIHCLDKQMYRAHLEVTLKAQPYFNKSQRAIGLKQSKISKISLVHDEYLLVKSSTSLLHSLTPGIFKGLINATLEPAKMLLNEVNLPLVQDYLTLFSEVNKQKVIDFHRPQVERQIGLMFDSGQLQYPLDNEDFEEKLFADFGQDIEVSDHQLVFKF